MRLLQHQWGLNGDIGDISPVDIGHEMDPVLAKRVRERAHKGLKRLTTTRKKTGHTLELWNMNALRLEWGQKGQAQSLAWLKTIRKKHIANRSWLQDVTEALEDQRG